ncbi:hypothetical protein BGX28_005100 [Mortierella sp. GBA30]|nr:hypothetical protein BGX28_005100 [Mortierella sp. GBA30]
MTDTVMAPATVEDQDERLLQTGIRNAEDLEVYEVCNREELREEVKQQDEELGYSPNREDNHRKLMGTIRSSFLASRDTNERARNSKRYELMTGSEERQQQEQRYFQQQDHDGDLTVDLLYDDEEKQQYVPQQPYLSEKEPYYDHRHHIHFDEAREQELLDSIAQLEQQVTKLKHANEILQSSLRESEERNGCLISEHGAKLVQLEDDHSRSVQETKKRTKRLFDQVIQKHKKDEGKRLTTILKELQDVRSENSELRRTVDVLQKTAFNIEQDSGEDSRELCTFWKDFVLPRLYSGTSQCQKTRVSQPVNREKRGLWDIVQGQGQTGIFKSTASGPLRSKLNSTTNKTALTTHSSHAERDQDICQSDDHQEPQLSHTCKTALGQQCLAFLEQVLEAILKPSSLTSRPPTRSCTNTQAPRTSLDMISNYHPGCVEQDLELHFNGEEQCFRQGYQGQKKRYSDSSASSGKTIVASRPQPTIRFYDDFSGKYAINILKTGIGEKEELEQELEEQEDEHQKEIERLKTQCIRIYRESLEDVRAEMMAKMRSRH